MASTDTTTRIAPYMERLMDNAYVQDNLREAVESLRGARRRASKRRVNPARDEKVRRHVRQAAASFAEAASALKTGRKKPRKGRRRWLIVILGLGVLGAVALASSERLRRQILGDGSDDSAPPSATTSTATG